MATGAYPLVQCRNDAAGFQIHEQLFVRRGNCDPVPVMDLPPVGPVADPLAHGFPGIPDAIGTCDVYARFRQGYLSVGVGRFQRIGVTPNGKYVVIEVTNNHVLLGLESLSTEPPDEGIFVVGTNDGHVERVAAPSGRAIIELDDHLNPVPTGSPFFSVSPNSRFVTYEDRGPAPDGREADQIAVIDLKTRKQQLVTQLSEDDAPKGPVFVNDHTVLFFNARDQMRYTIDVDGSQPPKSVPNPSLAGGNVVLEFGIVGGSSGNAISGQILDETPVIDYHNDAPDPPVRELFFVDGSRELQLTAFGYPDTTGAARAQLSRGRVVFIASANPLAEQEGHRDRGNPDGVCQLFSIDTLGGRLRQVTHFPADAGVQHGCGNPGPGHACDVTGLGVDPASGSIAIASSCDPFGRNPNGEQFFSMRADGSGLRQTSAFRGVERFDGGVQVEMAGPPASSFLLR